MTISLLTRPGDEVVVQDPAFPTYECVVRYAGGRPVFVKLREENEFRLSIEDIEREIEGLHRLRGMIINSPHNPTGSVLGERDVEELLELAKKRNLFIISDEIYEDYVYEGKHRSFLQDSKWRDYVVYISGFSKTWAFTGMRLGYVVAREEIIKALEVFATNMYSCPPAPFQYAALKTLELGTGWFKNYLEEYKRRRDTALEELNRIPGVKTVRSRGTFYLFPNVRELLVRFKARDVDELARKILFETSVVMLPGTAFPLRGGDGYLRCHMCFQLRRYVRGLGGLES